MPEVYSIDPRPLRFCPSCKLHKPAAVFTPQTNRLALTVKCSACRQGDAVGMIAATFLDALIEESPLARTVLARLSLVSHRMGRFYTEYLRALAVTSRSGHEHKDAGQATRLVCTRLGCTEALAYYLRHEAEDILRCLLADMPLTEIQAYQSHFRKHYGRTPTRRVVRIPRAYHRYTQPAGWRDLSPRQRRERRVKAAPGRHTRSEWETVRAFYHHTCLRCGSTGALTADHVRPLVRGGRNDTSNLQPLCQSCNSTKGMRSWDYRPQFI